MGTSFSEVTNSAAWDEAVDLLTHAGEQCARARRDKDETRARRWSSWASRVWRMQDDPPAARKVFDDAYRAWHERHRMPRALP